MGGRRVHTPDVLPTPETLVLKTTAPPPRGLTAGPRAIRQCRAVHPWTPRSSRGEAEWGGWSRMGRVEQQCTTKSPAYREVCEGRRWSPPSKMRKSRSAAGSGADGGCAKSVPPRGAPAHECSSAYLVPQRCRLITPTLVARPLASASRTLELHGLRRGQLFQGVTGAGNMPPI